MNGYQKLKDEIKQLKHNQQHDANRATAYFFALIKYVPEDKKDEAAELIEYFLKQHEENKEYASYDPAVAMLKKENENR